MKHRNKQKKIKATKCRVESSRDGIMTISMPRTSQMYKPGDEVLVTTSREIISALSKRRTVSEIVAQGPIKSASAGRITVDTSRSLIVSRNAQAHAILGRHAVNIRTLKPSSVD